MKHIHVKSIQVKGMTVCGKVLDNKLPEYTKEEAAQRVTQYGDVICPKCAKAKQKKQLDLF